MLTPGPHDVVVADVAWAYYGDPGKNAAAGKHYACLPDADVLRLDVRSYMHPRHSLALVWATCPRLDFAIRAIEAWGLHYRGVAFVWVKTRRDGTPVGAQGVRASVTKPTTELLLAASTDPRGRPVRIADESVAQVYVERETNPPTGDWPEDTTSRVVLEEHWPTETVYAPRGAHSEKPAEVYARIERMYPTASKCELFARAERPGWTCVGDELPTPSRVRFNT